jgi:hypothetical protein
MTANFHVKMGCAEREPDITANLTSVSTFQILLLACHFVKKGKEKEKTREKKKEDPSQ